MEHVLNQTCYVQLNNLVQLTSLDAGTMNVLHPLNNVHQPQTTKRYVNLILHIDVLMEVVQVNHPIVQPI